MSHERLEREIGQLVEGFLADLARVLPNNEEREYSVEEMEKRMEGVVSVLSVLSQRWSLGIIFLLYMKGLKFNELRDLLPGISSRTLTDKLRMLEGSGILTRSVTSSSPVRVGYSLTTRGRDIALSCLPLIYQLRRKD